MSSLGWLVTQTGVAMPITRIYMEGGLMHYDAHTFATEPIDMEGRISVALVGPDGVPLGAYSVEVGSVHVKPGMTLHFYLPARLTGDSDFMLQSLQLALPAGSLT